MRKVRHARSGLFLMELMISILFFAVTAGICIRVFVKSHEISQNAKNLYQAQLLASSAAEVLEGQDAAEQDPDEILKEYFPSLAREGEAGCRVYYDENWDACKEGGAVYLMEISWQDAAKSQRTVEIVFSDFEKEDEKNEKKEIYSLTLKLYNNRRSAVSREAKGRRSALGYEAKWFCSTACIKVQEGAST